MQYGDSRTKSRGSIRVMDYTNHPAEVESIVNDFDPSPAFVINNDGKMPSERTRQIESFESFVSRGSDPQKGTGTLPSAVPIREVVIKKHVPTAEEKDIFK